MEPKPQANATHDKLLILYLLKKADLWLSELQIMRILSELGLMNYLSAKTALLALAQDKLVIERPLALASTYRNAPEGAATIETLENDVRLSMRDAIDTYFIKHRQALETESRFRAYSRTENGQRRVHLEIHADGRPVFEIALDADSPQEARTMTAKWPEEAVRIYQSVLANLC